MVGSAIQSAWAAGVDEVIVVDGGSTDGTKQFATQHSCVWLESRPGRATQQNRGAEAARGDLILFLHVDSKLPADASEQINKVLNEPMCYGGFRQQIENPSRIYRWIESGNCWRLMRRGMVYGDQGLFVSRAAWREYGPFPEEPLMEDYLLSKELRRFLQPILLSGPLVVSARRWEKYGPVRQTLRNWAITLACCLGVSPSSLVKFYRRHDQ